MKKIWLLFNILFMLFLVYPENVKAEFMHKSEIVNYGTDASGLKTYTYNLYLDITGSTKVNHIEGRLLVTNLRVESFVANTDFVSNFDSNALTYNMTSNKSFGAGKLVYATIRLKQIEADKECSFSFEPKNTGIVPANDFTITKVASALKVKPLEEFDYTITVNSKDNLIPTDDVIVTDTIPSEFEIVNIPSNLVRYEYPRAISFAASTNGNKIDWHLGKFSPGVHTATFSVRVRAKSTTKGSFDNTAILKVGDKTLQSTATVNVVYSDIKISKSASVSKTKRNGEYYYAITVRNVGTGDSENVVVTDNLDNNLDYVRSNITCLNNANNACSTGESALKFNLGKLAPNASRTILVYVKVKDNITVSSIPNTAIAREDGKSPIEATVNVDVIPDDRVSNINILKSASVEEVKSGLEYYYNLVISNIGDKESDNVTVTDTIDSNLEFISADKESTKSGSTYTFNIGKLAPSASVTIRINVKAKENLTVYEIPNVGIASEVGKEPIDSKVIIPVVIEEIPRVRVVKSADVTEITLNTKFTYTIKVTNESSKVLNNINLQDVIDSNLAIIEVKDGKNNNNVANWSFSLNANESKTFTVTVKLKENSKAKEIKNMAVAKVPELGDVPSNEVTLIVLNVPNNPQTGYFIDYAMIGILTTSGLGIMYYIKKNKKIYHI